MDYIDRSARDWNPVQLCEALAQMHGAVVNRTDQWADYRHPVFIATRLAMDAAIAAAYPREVADWGHDRFVDAVREGSRTSLSTVQEVVHSVVVQFAAGIETAHGDDASRVASPGGASVVAGDLDDTQDSTSTPNPWAASHDWYESVERTRADRAALRGQATTAPAAQGWITRAVRANREVFRNMMGMAASAPDSLRPFYLNAAADMDRHLSALGFTTCRHGMPGGYQCGAISVRNTDRCTEHFQTTHES